MGVCDRVYDVVSVCVMLGVCEGELVAVRDCDAVTVVVGVVLLVAVGVGVPEPLPVTVWELLRVALGVSEGVREAVAPWLLDAVGVRVELCVAVSLGVTEDVSVALGVDDSEVVGLEVCSAASQIYVQARSRGRPEEPLTCDREGVCVCERVAAGLGESVGEPVELRVKDWDCDVVMRVTFPTNDVDTEDVPN